MIAVGRTTNSEGFYQVMDGVACQRYNAGPSNGRSNYGGWAAAAELADPAALSGPALAAERR